MSKKGRVERIVKTHQDNRLLVLGEIAGLALLAFKSRAWEDPGLIARSEYGIKVGREKTAAWTYLYPSMISTLSDRLVTARDSEEMARLNRLRASLEKRIGKVVTNAVSQVREIDLGEIPNRSSRSRPEISARVDMLGAEGPDGSSVWVHEIEVERDFELEPPGRVERFREVMSEMLSKCSSTDEAPPGSTI